MTLKEIESLIGEFVADTEDNAFTVPALAARMGIGEAVVRRRVQGLLRAGSLTPTKVRVTDMAGRVLTVSGYKKKG